MLIEKHLSSIWNFIAENKLYLEHIPENSLTNTYNIARMILIVAAFEWNVKEFGKLLDISISEKKLGVKNNIIEKMKSLSTSYNSKQRSYLNSYIKQIEMYDISLSNKIDKVIRKYENILLPFVKMIYKYNNELVTGDYINKISKRIEEHRNAFAHGNIKMEIDNNIILDLHILQWAIYCIILDEMGFQEDEIKSFIKYTCSGNVYIAQDFIDEDKD